MVVQVNDDPVSADDMMSIGQTTCIQCLTNFNPNIPICFTRVAKNELIWWHVKWSRNDENTCVFENESINTESVPV